MNDVLKNLKELEIEDLIWIITLFTTTFAIISNQLEREYIITGEKKKQKEFKTINITILCITFFIYLYFLMLAYSRFKSATPNTTFKQLRVFQANFITAVLLVIASIIYLITSIISDDNIDIDILA